MAEPPIPPEHAPPQNVGPATRKQRKRAAAGAGEKKPPSSASYRLILGMELSPLAQRALELAALYAAASGGRAPTSTSLLLFALADLSEPAERTSHSGEVLKGAIQRSGRYEPVRSHYFGERGIPASLGPLASGQVSESLPLTGRLAETLRRSEVIALSTDGGRRVHARHLIASLLHEERGRDPAGATRRLREMGVQIVPLRLELLRMISGLPDRGDVTAWEGILGAGGAEYLPSFHADTAGGEDLLGITREVAAFARLIATREVAPPLSIGLFGEWGSGKTFFMSQLRRAVSALARDARNSGRMQRDLPYYKRVVQIEFNAWHYVEGNLWASLVQHILENLRLEPDDPPVVTQRLRESLLLRLMDTEAVEREAAEAASRAASEVESAERHLQDAEERRKKAERKLQELDLASVRRLFPLPDVRARLEPVLASLGLRGAGSSAEEVRGTLRDARAALLEGGGLVTALLRAPDAGPRLFFLAGTLALGAAGTFGALLLDDGARTLSAGLATSSLPAAAEWLRRQTGWVRGRLDALRAVEEEYDRKLAEALAEHDAEVERLRRRVERVAGVRQAAEVRLARAREEVATAQQALQEASSARLLGRFIQDRAASRDYRRHLGVAALIRNDFEKLSGLIEDDNWCLAPELPGEPPRKGLRKFASLEEEREAEESRINRIVLYIDDLDRCPPRRVVEVLQAVHLLLAFPLFVVVVGVDARWITRALATRYRELLHREGDSIEEDEELIGKASSADYLEKIFQIPFWLSAMDHDDAARMVVGLLGGGSAEGAPPASPQAVEAVEPAGGKGQYPAPGSPPAGGPQPGTPELETRRLAIHPAELEFMRELAPLLGRSPRALKRFVNVYRLLKASLGPLEEERFLDERRGAFRTVLFLIGVDTGAPLAGPTVFGALASAAKVEPGPTRTVWAGLLDVLRAPPLAEGHVEQREHLQRVAHWLQQRPAGAFLEERDVLAEWLPRVQRYSFHGGRSGAPPPPLLQRPNTPPRTVPPPTA